MKKKNDPAEEWRRIAAEARSGWRELIESPGNETPPPALITRALAERRAASTEATLAWWRLARLAAAASVVLATTLTGYYFSADTPGERSPLLDPQSFDLP